MVFTTQPPSHRILLLSLVLVLLFTASGSAQDQELESGEYPDNTLIFGTDIGLPLNFDPDTLRYGPGGRVWLGVKHHRIRLEYSYLLSEPWYFEIDESFANLTTHALSLLYEYKFGEGISGWKVAGGTGWWWNRVEYEWGGISESWMNTVFSARGGYVFLPWEHLSLSVEGVVNLMANYQIITYHVSGSTGQYSQEYSQPPVVGSIIFSAGWYFAR